MPEGGRTPPSLAVLRLNDTRAASAGLEVGRSTWHCWRPENSHLTSETAGQPVRFGHAIMVQSKP